MMDENEKKAMKMVCAIAALHAMLTRGEAGRTYSEMTKQAFDLADSMMSEAERH